MDDMALLNGKVGLLLYHSLHSELLGDENERMICHNILREALTQLNTMNSFDNRFIDGPMSLPYVISILAKLDIVDLDIDLGAVVLKYLKHNPYVNVVPSIITDDRACLGDALSLVSVFPDDDSLLSYSIQESIITYIDHCDRLLNLDVPPIYYRKEMSCQYLHSIFYFLECVRRLNIYPTKVNRLLLDINQNMSFLKDKEKSVHLQILYWLEGKDVDFSGFNKSDPFNTIKDLAILGIYSAMYNIDIFSKFIHSVYSDCYEAILEDIRECDFCLDSILGIGIGLSICRLRYEI